MNPPTTFSESLLENQGWLLRFVRRLVTDDFAAEDIVQETFLQAYHDDKAKHRGWLAGTARNKALEWQRKLARRKQREQFVALDPNKGAEAILANSAEVAELASLAMSGIEELPSKQQQALLLQFMLGLKPQQVGEKMELPVEEVYRLTERGRKSVQQRLELKHGPHWRSYCGGLIGLSVLPSAAVALKPLIAAAAILLMAAAAVWYGLDERTPDSSRALELVNLEAPAAPAAEAELELLAAPLRQPMQPPARNNFFGVLAHLVDEQGNPIVGAEITAYFDESPRRHSTFLTDEDGYAFVALPNDVSEANLKPLPVGYLVKETHSAAGFPAPEVEIIAVKGTWAQSFQVVDYLDRPIVATQLMIWPLEPGLGGVFRTDAAGRVDALLQGPGNYYVYQPHRSAWNLATFPLNADTSATIIPIRGIVPATDVHILCVDAETGLAIPSATFTANSLPRDEFGVATELVSYPMIGDFGKLDYAGYQEDPFLSSITVRAEGYQPAIVEVYQDPEPGENVLVKLKPVAPLPARIVFENPQLSVASAEIRRQVDLIEWPPSRTPGSRDTATCPLTVAADGSFIIPQSAGGQHSFLHLNVTDDRGTLWQLRFQDFSQIERDSQGVLQFLCANPPEIPFTVTLRHADGSPVAGARLECGTTRPHDNSSSAHTTDINGSFQFLSYARDEIAISWSYGHLYIRGEFHTPSQGEAFSAVLQLPPLDGHLSGTALLHNGSPVSRFSTRATASQTIPLQVAGGAVAHLEYSVLSNFHRNGEFEIHDIPEGQYSVEVLYRNVLKASGVQHTGVPGTYTLPAFQSLHFEVKDSSGRAIATARLNALTTDEPGFSFSDRTPVKPNGSITYEDTRPSDDSVFVMSATGYAPTVLVHPIPNQVNQVVLQPGRDLNEIDTLASGIALEAGKSWIVDLWGDYSDPRQALVGEDYSNHQLSLRAAPLESFRFLEIDANGTPTSRFIEINSRR